MDAGRTDAAVKEIEQEYALDAKLADSANMSGDAQLIGNILLNAGRPTRPRSGSGRRSTWSRSRASRTR